MKKTAVVAEEIDVIAAELVSRKRQGKTRVDMKANAKQQNANNKAARAMWQNATRGQAMADASKFPSHTCNGKKSRAYRAPNPATKLSKGGATRNRATLRKHGYA